MGLYVLFDLTDVAASDLEKGQLHVLLWTERGRRTTASISYNIAPTSRPHTLEIAKGMIVIYVFSGGLNLLRPVVVDKIRLIGLLEGAAKHRPHFTNCRP